MTDPTILFQDDVLLVVNKPAGMIVNKADTTKDEITLQDFLEEHFTYAKTDIMPERMTATGEYDPAFDFYGRAGIVHRLDKETSGIILVAKTLTAFINLQKQFKERVVQKTYIALAHGKITPDNGEINVPVGRLEFNRKRFGVVAGGREASTTYAVLRYVLFGAKKQKETLSMVELYPHTGRTHQIRVHLKYINHPIFSDPLYAGRKVAREDRKYLERVFLHASKITFLHPETNNQMQFEAPLPSELTAFLNSCSPSVE